MYFPTSATLIEFLILSIIEKNDSYGYEISQTIKLVANIKESTLYPILKKIGQAGYVTTYSQEYQGRKRKYYRITPEGTDHLAFLRGEWQSYKDTVDGIIEGRLRHDKD
ncbi:PadR family transcriptional regulator [Streptococcus saliviloxodontae]|uniref:PadR family transcriptional regulator PadR n=1 Tax=Streptococcus saliviloxodontae TaxID=1349416 RepID=A0ABS2PL04_9STRE|nr:PadR family transcriptional regulator [Streptococcus saliviloxodontae]MBM7636044.1 PadR family transcriptional regulator PadR [Streptococcus saliviloxodontae]